MGKTLREIIEECGGQFPIIVMHNHHPDFQAVIYSENCRYSLTRISEAFDDYIISSLSTSTNWTLLESSFDLSCTDCDKPIGTCVEQGCYVIQNITFDYNHASEIAHLYFSSPEDTPLNEPKKCDCLLSRLLQIGCNCGGV